LNGVQGFFIANNKKVVLTMAGKEMDQNYLGTGSGYNANSFTPAYFNRPENMASTFASDSFNLKLPSINQNLTT